MKTTNDLSMPPLQFINTLYRTNIRKTDDKKIGDFLTSIGLPGCDLNGGAFFYDDNNIRLVKYLNTTRKENRHISCVTDKFIEYCLTDFEVISVMFLEKVTTYEPWIHNRTKDVVHPIGYAGTLSKEEIAAMTAAYRAGMAEHFEGWTEALKARDRAVLEDKLNKVNEALESIDASIAAQQEHRTLRLAEKETICREIDKL